MIFVLVFSVICTLRSAVGNKTNYTTSMHTVVFVLVLFITVWTVVAAVLSWKINTVMLFAIYLDLPRSCPYNLNNQGAKKVVSDSPGLVDFAIRLVNSVLNLPDGQAKIFRRIKIILQKYCKTNVLNF